MNKFIKVALVILKTVIRTALTTTCCTLQFLFLKSLAVAVLLHSKSLTEIG